MRKITSKGKDMKTTSLTMESHVLDKSGKWQRSVKLETLVRPVVAGMVDTKIKLAGREAEAERRREAARRRAREFASDGVQITANFPANSRCPSPL